MRTAVRTRILSRPAPRENDWRWRDKIKEGWAAVIPPTFLDAVTRDDKIKAAGYIPMALGGGSWAERFVFQKVLVSIAGPEFCLKILRDRDVAALQDPKVQEAFEV